MWPYFLRKRLKTIKSARLTNSAREEASLLVQRAIRPKWTICFTKASLFRQPRVVRKSFGACLLVLIVLSCVHAQEQESKLVDRLLRPDTTLRNNAQNKKFIADGASINKRATVGTFYVQEKS